MVNICNYPGCNRKQKRYNPDSFHRLPLRYGRTIVNRWLVVLNIDINTPTETLRQKSYRVCGAHFNKDDFLISKSAADPKNPLKTYLKKTAVPRVEQLATGSALQATGFESAGVHIDETELEAVPQSTPQKREDQSVEQVTSRCPPSTVTFSLTSPEPVVRPCTKTSLSGVYLARPPTWELSKSTAASTCRICPTVRDVACQTDPPKRSHLRSKGIQVKAASRDCGMCTLTFPLDSPILFLQPTIVKRPSKRPRLSLTDEGEGPCLSMVVNESDDSI